MDGAIGRLLWRCRGAWMWPTFVALTIADGVIGHLMPPAGETETLYGAMLLGGAFNLLAVLFLSRPIGALLRRGRPDLPALIARNYGGTTAIAGVSAIVLVAGLAHRSTVTANRQSLADAIVRAQAYIGDRAPAEFRRNLSDINTYAIEPGSVYRTCVHSDQGPRSYCVVVRMKMPFGQGVSFAGYESNAVFAQGAW